MPVDQHLTICDVIDQTRDDLRRVDGAAAIHIVGIAALIGEIGADLPTRVLAGVGCAVPFAAATIIAAATVLWPRHLTTRGAVAPGSWLHAASEPSWATLQDAYRDHDPGEYTSRQLWILARIVKNKYVWLRRSTILLWATITTLIVGAGSGVAATLIWGR